MFGFLLPLPWLGERAARIAIAALTAYALLPIVRNTYAGIRGIDPAIIEVARALGLTGRQRLFKVELPLAASFIFAGLRTATVTCVGIATIAAAVGAGGLGELIFRGVASVDNRLVLAGAIPAALLALAADGALGLLEHMVQGSGAMRRPIFCRRGFGFDGARGLRTAAGGSSGDWREEFYGAGGAGRVAGAGD